MKRFFIFICALFAFSIAHAESYIVLCPENYYVDGDFCKPCPKEFVSPGGNVTECTRKCQDGQYCIYRYQNSTKCTCTACPDGYPHSDPDATTINQCYSDIIKTREYDGTVQCRNIPNGCQPICTGCESEPEPCEYTEYYGGGIHSGCATNTCLSDNLVKIATAETTAWQPELNICAACPAGSILKKHFDTTMYLYDNTCEACPAGSYSVGNNATTCTQCPAGTYSATGASECTPCPVGSYSNAGSSECTTCAAGTYYDASGATCKKCPDAYPESDAGITDISQCYGKKNRECPAPIGCADAVYSNNQCEYTEQCEKLIYIEPALPWDEPVTTCTNPFVKSGCTDCGELISVTALPGYRLNGNTCEQCPAGTFSVGGNNTECAPCTDGTYSAAGANECTPICDAGYTYINGTCTKCPDEYPNSDGISCYSDVVKTRECTAVPTGCADAVYSSNQCEYTEQCEKLTYIEPSLPWDDPVINCTYIGVKSGCTDCGEPTFVSALPGYHVKGTQCEQCQAGTYSAGGDNTECTPCPAGTYSKSGSSQCYDLCDTGYYHDGNECKKCPDEYPNSDGISCYSDVKIRECPAVPTGCSAIYENNTCEYTEQCNNPVSTPGLMPWDDNVINCENGIVVSGCTSCGELLSITALPGYRLNGDACEVCPAGTFSTGGDNNECEPCKKNTYSSSGAAECTPCPDGFYTDGTGSTSIAACSGEFERPWTGHQVCDVPGCISGICTPCEIKPCKYVMGYKGGALPWDPFVEYVISGCTTNDANCATPIHGVIAAPGWGAIGVTRCEQCAAGSYSAGGENAQCTQCPTNKHVSRIGATDIGECGRILNYQKQGNDTPTQIFLNGIRNTSPSFNVQIGDDILYANMTPVSDTTRPGMYVKYNNQSYKITNSYKSITAIFTITTTNTKEFSISISAAGVFTIDWGDGNLEDIVQTNTDISEYSHKYATAESYDIGLSGNATRYSSSAAAISFSASAANISRISGSLGRIFPTIGDGGNGNQPLFTDTFLNATNLTGEIPAELFDDIGGTPVKEMFINTFYGCSGLTGQSARVAGVPLYEYATRVSNACPIGLLPWDPITCATYSGATGLSDYDTIPAEFK